jgi:signal transduction histidine kinase
VGRVPTPSDRVALQQERTEGLLLAVAAVTSELDLQSVLRRIAEVAAELVDARYGAVGVISVDGSLSQFVTVGLDSELAERIGPLPHGLGILGELIRHPVPLRLRDLRDHPASYGFPPDHPAMTSFLGVPIRVRERVFGNLYLTDKRSGDFDADDEQLVLGLAAVAGIAVENASLFERSSRRERSAAAAAEITTSLLSGADPETVLELAAERASDLVSADLGLIAQPHGDRLLVEVSWGPGPDAPTGTLTPGGPIGQVLLSSQSRVFDNAGLGHVWPELVLGGAVGVPLGKGVCVAARKAPALPFTEEEVQELTAFAGQATVALELAQRRRDVERLSVYADRDRIARDLHDLVIQRLFATGMQLESVVRQVPDPTAQARVRQAVDDLDETIREIRGAIYALGHDEIAETTSLRVRLLEALDAAEQQLGFAPAVRMSGLLDTRVPPPVQDHVLSVLREALSNVARHSRAGRVDVEVEAYDELVLRVVDDGIGLPEGGRRSGLQNLQERAELLGGSLYAASAPVNGTELIWRVPLQPS